ncbi:3-phosphoshikimate 1-carboxyvinyltransferase [Ornithinibacillus xuwenensis]|uniref:3-phosphoshikimate 1-carboxyvinyltransferase n=1 Tax=Ornithinibacillus xuwenensis TaxID=3144668 RepID=A0ABU9XD72_9BACI
MKTLKRRGTIYMKGELEVPGDKSISHRAVILGSIANGITKVENFLDSEDCMRTVEAFRSMGVSITTKGTFLEIEGKGLSGLLEPLEPLYFGNSGTTARLMIGLLAGLPFSTVVYGDVSLTNRPMDRVITPINKMGATVLGRNESSYLPLALKGGNLEGITYELPVKSAQVKSGILLAGLQAKGTTRVIEQQQTRDHTERMLKAFGANIEVSGNGIQIDASKSLLGTDVYVPGDISSAAFMLSAAAIIPGSNVTVKKVGINKTRIGFLEVLQKMGANISISNERVLSGEDIGDVQITYNQLTGVVVEGEIIPRLIDEIPIIALLATQAEGNTIIRNAEELRVKETDRIAAVVNVLRTMGANIEATDEGMIIKGKSSLKGGSVSAYQDHRIAMMIVIASLISEQDVTIDDISSISISYPRFLDDLESILKNNS